MGVIATYENFVEAKKSGYEFLLENLKEDYPNYYNACNERYEKEKTKKYRSSAEVLKRVNFMNREVETINDYESFEKGGYLQVLELKHRNPEMYQEFRQRRIIEQNKPDWAR